MNRRNFLSLFSAGVAGIALEQAIPLGRVWSFPKEIKIANLETLGLTTDYWVGWSDDQGHHWYKAMQVGGRIRLPLRDRRLYEIRAEDHVHYRVINATLTVDRPTTESHLKS